MRSLTKGRAALGSAPKTEAVPNRMFIRNDNGSVDLQAAYGKSVMQFIILEYFKLKMGSLEVIYMLLLQPFRTGQSLMSCENCI